MAYLPKPLQQQVSVSTLKNLTEQELRWIQARSSQEAQISFIGGSGTWGLQGPERETMKGRGEVEGSLSILPCSAHPSWRPGRAGPRAPVTSTPLPAPSFTEAVSKLPLFGYTVYVVLRVSQMALPGPCFLGLNRQRLILMEPSSQVGQAPAPVLA